VALKRRGKPAALLHHWAQGSQRTRAHFQRLLFEQGITCNMSSLLCPNSHLRIFFSLKGVLNARTRVKWQRCFSFQQLKQPIPTTVPLIFTSLKERNHGT